MRVVIRYAIAKPIMYLLTLKCQRRYTIKHINTLELGAYFNVTF